MGRMRMKLALAAVAVAALSLAACSDDSPAPAPEMPITQTDAPDNGEEEGFEGETADETIKVGPMDVIVPKGFKLPDDSIVSKSDPYQVMIIDEDPQPVIDAVRKSAEEAGYEVYAQLSPDHTVFVGQGNAVLFVAVPNAQMITWGPEVMKDALAEG